MPTTVSMPQLGETVTEGTVLRWMKQVGDSIARDEAIVEISTDKVDTEVPSPVAGVVSEILVGEGETIEVGTAMVVIASADEGVPAAAPAEAEAPRAEEEEAPPPPPAPAPATTSAVPGRPAPRKFLSPVVRRLAREHDIDPSVIKGTGRDGRVTRNDVLAYIESIKAAPEPAPAPTAPAPEPAPAPVPTGPEPADPGPPMDEPVKLSRLRVRIADNMVASLRTAAHVWTSMEVDYERVERVRQAHRESFRQQEGFSLTYLPFIARATMEALRAFPVVNSSFDQEGRTATFHQDVNLGIAVDLNQDGLMVVTIPKADDYSLRALARKVRDLAVRARGGRVGPDDVSASTFTITNPGPYGSFMSAPVINVPNVAILSTDGIAKRPKVVTTPDGADAIAIRPLGYLGLSWDHRAFDGAVAVLFLRRIKDNLETWDWEQQLT
ncbi:MAG: dihydrolipoamide acetyltransferase family protein [bacterium]|nr:dihydrolipoamide acetyltransferase family protein [bacterium]MDE0353056.1 dihydrolipoamide acetyltransferase family protein [bacterium]